MCTHTFEYVKELITIKVYPIVYQYRENQRAMSTNYDYRILKYTR